jgi:NAD(P)-dependent dehydrogenase (short-subunit alcohol dehydrogenase family)
MLSLLLTPVLERSSALRGRPARLLVVTSEVHAFSHFDKATAPDVYRVETDASEAHFSHGQAYQLSKLFITLLIRELAMRLDPSKIIVAKTSPGFCSTGLLDDIHGFIPRMTTKIFARSADQGARLYLHAALLTSDEEYSGGYFRSGVSVK